MANKRRDLAERSMQPGSGTTDLIAGAYYHQKLTESAVSWFAQGQYQHALNTRDNYRPGAQLGLDLGVRKTLFGALGVLVQLNYVHKGGDNVERVRQFARALRVTYPIIAGNDKPMAQLKVKAYPTTLLFHPQGKLVLTRLGQVTRAELETHLPALAARP